jgi:molecular chaperone GrpE
MPENPILSEHDRIEPTMDRVDPAPRPAATESRAPASAVEETQKQSPAQSQPQSESQGESPALAEVQAQLAELQAKNALLAEQYLRAQADMQNTRRRAEDEMSKARKFAVESFAESLLAVADSLEAGLAHQDATSEQIREGAEATLRQLKSVLERNKVIEINPAAGAKFDPHQHQAISVVPAPPGSSQEANTVVTVLQKGYLIAERVLRPALVTVAAPK